MGNNKPNRNKNNNRSQQKPQRYTGKNVDYMGDPGRMERHSIDVFRDMSRGKYNFNNIVEFQNRDFVMAAIRAAEKNMKRHDILVTALNFTYGSSNDPDVIAMKNQELASYNGWAFIRNSLYAFMNTMDFGALYGLANQLSSNRELRL